MTEPCHALPRNFLRTCVLLLLREQPDHGYDLSVRLEPLGFGPEDHGRLYRTLRRLEDEELVASHWAPSHHGPDRRVYALTEPGVTALHEETLELESTSHILGNFLCRCAEASQAPVRVRVVQRTPT